jgi:hypothetical protein
MLKSSVMMSAHHWREHVPTTVHPMTNDRHGTASTTPTTVRPLLIDVEDVLVGPIGAPSLFTGQSPSGQRWLVAKFGESVEVRRWLCAPASDLAIHCVLSGRAQPADLFRHSATGTVEDITIGSDGRLHESIRLCAELTEREVSPERLVSHTPATIKSTSLSLSISR